MTITPLRPAVKAKRLAQFEEPLAKRHLPHPATTRPYVIEGLALNAGAVFGTSANECHLCDTRTLQTSWTARPAQDARFACLARGADASTFWSTDSAGLRLHDVRTRDTIGTLVGPSRLPYTAMATATSHELAAGTSLVGSDALIELWDTRSPARPVRVYSESHSDDITSLCFKSDPEAGHLLLSASTDGLFSIFDTRQADEDECILGVGQTGASLKSAGWAQDGIWALSDMMTLQFWSLDSEGSDLKVDYGDVREVELVHNWQSDYVIQIDTSDDKPSLNLRLGSPSGGIASVSISPGKPETWSVGTIMRGGHDDVVRCIVPLGIDGSYLSGGEDGAVCVWSAAYPGNADPLPVKQKARFNPYSR